MQHIYGNIGLVCCSPCAHTYWLKTPQWYLHMPFVHIVCLPPSRSCLSNFYAIPISRVKILDAISRHHATLRGVIARQYSRQRPCRRRVSPRECGKLRDGSLARIVSVCARKTFTLRSALRAYRTEISQQHETAPGKYYLSR